MKVQLHEKSISALYRTDILFQSSFWSRVKSSLGWSPLAFDFTSSTGLVGDILVLLKSYQNHIKGAHVPQGPEYGPDTDQYGSFLEKLSEELSRRLDSSVAFIQYDLPWPSPYAREGEEWTGRPVPRLQELRMNYGTQSWNLRKAHSDLTVADSVIVDLTSPEDSILGRMKPKTRYNIGLAGRKGVRIIRAGESKLPLFYDLYLQTAERNGFIPSSYEHFQAIFSTHARHPELDVVFLFAVTGRTLLSSSINIISGRRATYLFGASSNENRSMMGCYALHWEAIRAAKAEGCHSYDMGSIAPLKDPSHPFYGMYRFKTGFGGSIFHRSGTWDYPLNPSAYQSYRNKESLLNVSVSQ